MLGLAQCAIKQACPLSASGLQQPIWFLANRLLLLRVDPVGTFPRLLLATPCLPPCLLARSLLLRLASPSLFLRLEWRAEQ